MNKTVRDNLRCALHEKLDQGHFPEVRWARKVELKHGEVKQYDTSAYLMVWGRWAHLVDSAMKQRGYNMGCFELKRSNEFRVDVTRIIHSIEPGDVAACTQMFGIPGGR